MEQALEKSLTNQARHSTSSHWLTMFVFTQTYEKCTKMCLYPTFVFCKDFLIKF